VGGILGTVASVVLLAVLGVVVARRVQSVKAGRRASFWACRSLEVPEDSIPDFKLIGSRVRHLPAKLPTDLKTRFPSAVTISANHVSLECRKSDSLIALVSSRDGYQNRLMGCCNGLLPCAGHPGHSAEVHGAVPPGHCGLRVCLSALRKYDTLCRNLHILLFLVGSSTLNARRPNPTTPGWHRVGVGGSRRGKRDRVVPHVARAGNFQVLQTQSPLFYGH